MDRQARASWLTGPAVPLAGYAGDRLGLPASGRGSVAGYAVRLGSTLVDALIGYLVGAAVSLLFGIKVTATCATPGNPQQPICPAVAQAGFDRSLVISLTFLVLVALMLAVSGRTFGMRLTHLQLVRLDGGIVGWRALPRTVLTALVIPALLTDRDSRGLHDRLTRTVVVRTR